MSLTLGNYPMLNTDQIAAMWIWPAGNVARSENVRRIWPFLRDRRIDAYDDLLKRFRD